MIGFAIIWFQSGWNHRSPLQLLDSNISSLPPPPAEVDPLQYGLDEEGTIVTLYPITPV